MAPEGIRWVYTASRISGDSRKNGEANSWGRRADIRINGRLSSLKMLEVASRRGRKERASNMYVMGMKKERLTHRLK